MVDLVIELVLIVAILVPMIATAPQPVRAVSRSCWLGKLRRGN